jgi:Kef-type K+ transport system membrane component KefB
MEVMPSVFAAVALTATSVGVSLAVWRDAGAIDSDDGALLLDLAELDDLSAVLLLALLLALAPAIQGMGEPVSLPGLGAWLLIKLAGFAALCVVFAHYLEARFTRWLSRSDGPTGSIVPVAGIAFVIAALAELLGFSMAVGALFAGLAFSRDPKRVRLDRAFETLYRFFVPFFFVGNGLDVAIDALGTSLALGGLLLVVAIVAKVAGTALPLVLASGGSGALLIGVSMVPRAEIAMIVMERGQALGDWAVPPELYAGMVLVSLGTCLVTPPAIRYLLARRQKGATA